MAETVLPCTQGAPTLLIEPPHLRFCTLEQISLMGSMAVYSSQAEASRGIPQQWRDLRAAHPFLNETATFYGASPCTADHKIHYLAGVEQGSAKAPVGLQTLTLDAGEYVVVQVSDPNLLRETWQYMLSTWLPDSGRSERRSPEFERFSSLSEAGTPRAPVEVWIPLEPLSLIP